MENNLYSSVEVKDRSKMENDSQPQSNMNKINNKGPKTYLVIKLVVKNIENILLAIGGILLIGMLITISFSVGNRAILGNSILWLNELASYLMLGVVFISAPWVLRYGAHVNVDLITSNLNGKKKRVFNIYMSTIGGIACSIYFWFTLTNTIHHYLSGTVDVNFPWPRFALYIPMVLGFLFLAVRFLLNIFDAILNIESEEENSDSAFDNV